MDDTESAEAALPTSSPPDEMLGSPGNDCDSENTAVAGTTDETRNEVEKKEDETNPGDEELARARSLSVGAIHKHYCKDLLEAANTLQSICNVQDTSITLIEYKEKVLVELRESYQLEEILDEAQRYSEKLISLKREMASLSKKSKELTRRAAYVKSVREKERAKMDQEKKRLERLEQDLAPRYSSDLA